MENKTELYRAELENLTGKLYRGDMTPLVYNLLKDSPHLDKLLEDLTGVKYTKKLPEVNTSVSASSFDDWFMSQPVVKGE